MGGVPEVEEWLLTGARHRPRRPAKVPLTIFCFEEHSPDLPAGAPWAGSA